MPRWWEFRIFLFIGNFISYLDQVRLTHGLWIPPHVAPPRYGKPAGFSPQHGAGKFPLARDIGLMVCIGAGIANLCFRKYLEVARWPLMYLPQASQWNNGRVFFDEGQVRDQILIKVASRLDVCIPSDCFTSGLPRLRDRPWYWEWNVQSSLSSSVDQIPRSSDVFKLCFKTYTHQWKGMDTQGRI